MNSNFSEDIIVIDTLSEKTTGGPSPKWENDIETYMIMNRGLYTIDFLGANCYNNLIKFKALQASQKSVDWQRANGYSIFYSNNVSPLNNIIGSTQNNERLQIVLIADYSYNVGVETLNITSADINFKLEE